MIKHMVLFRFKPDVSDAAQIELLNEMAQLPSRYPAMKRFGLARNASERDQLFSHVMTMEFDTMADLKAYLNHGYHEMHVATRFKPLIEQRAIASYEAPGDYTNQS